MNLENYKDLIEKRLGLIGCLKVENNRIIPSEIITKEYIKNTHSDDLFSFQSGKIYFTTRFLHFVSEMTDRKVLTGHYFLEMR